MYLISRLSATGRFGRPACCSATWLIDLENGATAAGCVGGVALVTYHEQRRKLTRKHCVYGAKMANDTSRYAAAAYYNAGGILARIWRASTLETKVWCVNG